ncbi:MAG TPA: hypothetical protein VNT32_04110 [Thermoleophilaceae bacterium]|nr:hypothetical protein [Thermoleophilaceae bacterium]
MTRALITASLLTAVLAVPASAVAQISLPGLPLPSGDPGGTLTTVVDAAGTVIGTVDPTTGAVVDGVGNVIGVVDEATGNVLDGTGTVIGTVLPGGTGSDGGSGGDDPGAQMPQASRPLGFTIRARRVQRGRSAIRRGVLASYRCTRACGIIIELRVSKRVAKAARLGSGRRSVRVGFAAVARSGYYRLKLSSRYRKRIDRYVRTAERTRSEDRRARSLPLQLRGIAFDGSGTPSRLRRATVYLKR